MPEQIGLEEGFRLEKGLSLPALDRSWLISPLRHFALVTVWRSKALLQYTDLAGALTPARYSRESID